MAKKQAEMLVDNLAPTLLEQSICLAIFTGYKAMKNMSPTQQSPSGKQEDIASIGSDLTPSDRAINLKNICQNLHIMKI